MVMGTFKIEKLHKRTFSFVWQTEQTLSCSSDRYTVNHCKVIISCVSIILQIAQIEIANWKYAQCKHFNFTKNPIGYITKKF